MRATNEVKVYLDRKTQWNSISHGLASTSIISPTLWDCVGREQEAANIQRALNVIQEAWRTIPEEHLKKDRKPCLRQFRLCRGIKEAVLAFKLIRIVQH